MQQQWDASEKKAIRQLSSCNRNRKAENKMIYTFIIQSSISRAFPA